MCRPHIVLYIIYSNKRVRAPQHGHRNMGANYNSNTNNNNNKTMHSNEYGIKLTRRNEVNDKNNGQAEETNKTHNNKYEDQLAEELICEVFALVHFFFSHILGRLAYLHISADVDTTGIKKLKSLIRPVI